MRSKFDMVPFSIPFERGCALLARSVEDDGSATSAASARGNASHAENAENAEGALSGLVEESEFDGT